MKVIFLNILLLFSTNLLAQPSSVESLKEELLSTQNSQEQIELLFKVGKLYFDEFPDDSSQNELENERLKSQVELGDKTILYIIISIAMVVIALILTLIFNYSLARKKRELQKVNESKDKIFSIVSHDLRGPVGNLNNLIDLMVEEKEELNYREVLNSFKPIIAQTYNMLENLLVWAKTNLGNLEYKGEKIPIKKAIKETISLIENIASNKSISILFNQKNEIYILADSILLQTILRNLLNNAIKFTPENGQIEIKTEVENKHCVISIIDNGVGIPEDKQDLLFKGHVHTLGTQNEKGSGIGILLCKELIEKNEGKLWFKSTEGEGSTFSFSVPLYVD